MKVSYISRNPLDPRKAVNYLDSCALNPHEGERDAATKILALGDSGEVIVAIPKTVKEELDNPKTPEEMRDRANGLFWAFAPSLTPAEQRKWEQVYSIIIGNAERPDKYEADANHVFEVGRRGQYFITADRRIIGKRAELKKACGVNILSPTEWLTVFEKTKQS